MGCRTIVNAFPVPHRGESPTDSRVAGASLQPEPLGSAVLHIICLLKAGLHMRGCRHPKQEHKQHHAKICNEKTGVWPPWRATSDRNKKDPSTEAKKMPRWTWRTCPSPTWTLVALRRVISRARQMWASGWPSVPSLQTLSSITGSTPLQRPSRPIPTLKVASPSVEEKEEHNKENNTIKRRK